MSDTQARAEAVEPHRSVIVQAPAGSGKTTLLVERYLGLLATVDAPEEILAITFTRKAAAEMRQRVLSYLDPEFESDAPHEQAPLAKARALQDKVRTWHLLENPQRMLIRTIDSFNHYLARTMPVASALGPVPAPADNSKALYRQAARRVLALLESNDDLAQDIERLLDWRDHRSQDVENLLANLLSKRDQWLRALSITGKPQRSRLEAVLYDIVSEQLGHAEHVLLSSLHSISGEPDELWRLLNFAANTLIEDNKHSPIQAFADVDARPLADPATLAQWQGLAEALLISTDNYRKSVTKTIGFPAKTDQKADFEKLLATFADNTELQEALAEARRMPAPYYSDDEWAVLDALVKVLQRAAGELELVFAQSGQTDYTGLAAAALRGLGDEDNGYTDLGLYLDQRIQHILVDEFQDTNWGQLHLLEKLTAGWQSGDGHSLFLVGDPMQSIYRFREAEVGLFIRTREFGLGALTLESKHLTQNFRSRQELVAWVNDRLEPIFPDTEDIAAGAVSYAPSTPGRSGGGQVKILANATDTAEADALVDIIEQQLAQHIHNANFKAAIIVKARSHLQAILPALTERNIPYRAVKLDPLVSRPVVQDLLAITRVIIQPADITAMLAILRSPVCGLTLADLHAIAGDGRTPMDPESSGLLQGEARQRAAPVHAALDHAQQLWRRRPIRDLVEGVWQRLGGPSCCQNPATDLRDADVYLDALDTATDNGLLEDWNDFLEMLDGVHTEGDPASDSVKLEILTMHGAKGLEWDLVILPGMNRPPGGRDTTLLHWLPFTTEHGEEQMLLAPLRAADQAKDPMLVAMIRGRQKARAAYENQRLLYVATTRAKEQLVLSACLDAGKDEIKPASGSLLQDLWPTVGADFLSALNDAESNRPLPNSVPPTEAQAETPKEPPIPDQSLRRIACHWQPDIPAPLAWAPKIPSQERHIDVEYNWAGVQARRTGTVLHRLLEQVGNIGSENFSAQARQQLITRIPSLLQAMGTRTDQLEANSKIICDAFESTLDSEIGQWMLSGEHTDHRCELAIAGVLDGQLVNAVVDRTFVDKEDVRWIIDYKSGYHAGTDLDTFLSQESERYRDQLGRYQELFAQLESRSIKTALYLPRHGKLQLV